MFFKQTNAKVLIIPILFVTIFSLKVARMQIPEEDLIGRIVSRLVWSPNGDKLAVASFAVDIEQSIVDTKIEILNGVNGQLLSTIQQGGSLIASLAWHPNNIDLYSGDFAGTLRKWNTSTNQLTSTFQISTSAIIGLSWNAQGSQLVAGGYDNTIRVLNSSGQVTNSLDLGASNLPGLATNIDWIAYSPDGLKIITSEANGAIIVRDATTLQETLRLPYQYVASATGDWSPNAAKLATTANANTAQIWKMASVPQLLFTLQGHTKAVSMISWNPAGDQLATASLDGTVRIWNALTGSLISVIQAQNLTEVWRIDWSSTGKLAYGGKVALDGVSPSPPIVEFPPSSSTPTPSLYDFKACGT